MGIACSSFRCKHYNPSARSLPATEELGILHAGILIRVWVRFTCRLRDRNKREGAKTKAKISVFFFFVLFAPFVDKNPDFHRQPTG
jgi:hypothetical protein